MVWPDLSVFGIQADSVRAMACADLNTDGNWQKSTLVFTKTELIRLTEAVGFSQADFTRHGEPTAPSETCTVDRFALSRCGEMSIEPQVASCLVTVLVDGAAFCLANSSNAHAEELRRFARQYNDAMGFHVSYRAEDDGERRPPFPHHGPPPGRGGRPIPDENQPRKGRLAQASLFLRLLRFFRPYAWQIIVMALCFAGSALMGLVTPYLSANVLYGQILEGKDALGGLISPSAVGPVTALFLLVMTLFAVYLATRLFTFLHNILAARVVPFVLNGIKSAVFDAMSRLSIRFYQSRETGMLMTRVLDDAADLSNYFIDDVPIAVVDGVTVVVAMVILLSLNVKLALLAAVLLVAPVMFTFFLKPILWTMYGRRHRAARHMNSQINDNISGGRVVRAFGTEQNERRRFASANERVGGVEKRIGKMEAWLYGCYSASATLMNVAVSAFGGYLILSREGNMNYALLLTFTGYVGMLSGPVDTISRFIKRSANCMNCAQRIFEIIDARPDVLEAEHPVHLDTIRGDIALEHVSFAYEPGKTVLKDVNLTAHAGEMIGIVGKSGAGKSTLLNLISRLYDCDEGRITIDGVDIRDLSMEDLHGLIAMVSQETYIFMGTVAENIAYARPDATHDEIVAAAVAASAHDFIVKLPDGYDTIIGPSGRELSGGERQRLSIARAILTDPRILILDEATAAVDTETEIRIQQALGKLIQGRTTLSVAHRLSTLRDASHLIVMEDGQIIERGTHTELMKQKGTYFRLATIQQRALSKRGLIE